MDCLYKGKKVTERERFNMKPLVTITYTVSNKNNVSSMSKVLFGTSEDKRD